MKRRQFLTGLTGLALTRSFRGRANPIQHVLLGCNENRSFDHYYGYAPFVGSYGVPAGYSQPDGNGGTVTPSHLTSGISPNPKHDWAHIHTEWNRGAMNGFYVANGAGALGYYNQS